MALKRGKLSNVVVVSASSTVGIITCESSKKVYIKSILAHSSGGGNGTAQVYFVPNGDTARSETKIFDVDVNAGETVLIEPSYPLVLDTTNDALFVGTGTPTGAAATHINFIVTGDEEV